MFSLSFQSTLLTRLCPIRHLADIRHTREHCDLDEDHDENQLDEFSDGSDSSDLEVDIGEESVNAFSFLGTTRSGRSIIINMYRSLLLYI